MSADGTAAVPVSPATLTRWAAASERACAECEQAEVLLLQTGGDGRVLEHVTRARETSWATYRALLDAGAVPTEGAGGVPAPAAGDPLRALALADTPATQHLLLALREAMTCAEAVDSERGNVLPEGIPLLPGESRGTGYAETLANIAERLRVEVEGPHRQAGRE